MQNSIEQATEIAQESAQNQSVIILITGFVVVFLMLLLLIGIIKIYSGIVYSAQNRAASKAKAKESAQTPAATPVIEAPEAQTPQDGTPDLQTVAVITAAVEAFYGSSKKVRITGIRQVSSARNEWATAGLRENIPAFRSEGLL